MRSPVNSPLRSRLERALLVISGLALGACSGDGMMRPIVTPPSVASVEVSATAGNLIALGRTAQLSATANDAQGNSVSGATFTWGSSNEAVATVSPSGLVTSIAAGSVTITATSEGVSGSLGLTVVAADLAGIDDLVGDPYVLQLIDHTNDNTEAQLLEAFSQVSAGVTDGNLSAIASALITAQSEVTGAVEATDVVLFAVMGLVLDHLERLLNL